jgi:Bifunctional DNA primase/polymerase, N-terminal
MLNDYITQTLVTCNHFGSSRDLLKVWFENQRPAEHLHLERLLNGRCKSERADTTELLKEWLDPTPVDPARPVRRRKIEHAFTTDQSASPDFASMTLLDAALAYAAMGVAVLPCEPSTKEPIGPLVPCDIGPKRKPLAGTGGLKKASRDPDVIRGWWRDRPDAMIGAATGAASGFWAVDPDAPKQVKKGRSGR